MDVIELVPTGLWSLASATLIMLMLVTLLLNLYYRKRLRAMSPIHRDLGDLVNKKQQLEDDIDSIKDWIASQNDDLIRLKAEREEQEVLRSELQRLEQEASLKEESNKTLRDEVAALENQRHLLVQSMEKLEQEKAALQKEIEQAGKDSSRASEDLTDVERRLDESRRKEKEVGDQIDKAKVKAGELEKELKTLETELKAAENSLKELEKKSEQTQKELEEQVQGLKKSIKDLEQQKTDREREVNDLSRREADLNGRVETLSKKLQTIGQMPKEAFDSLNMPVFKKSSSSSDISNEQEALGELYSLTHDCGFEIPERLQNAFHTSLKTSDISCLTVMAGVSGTGKSAFPKLYAQAMGMHFLPLAVEPRWDSPQDLFGFLNYMENRFEATTLGRALVQFDNSPHASEYALLNDQLLLVMLDEMNLARIEYYFSEFLSKLEMRRNVNVKSFADYRMVSSEIYAGGKEDKENKIKASDPFFLYAGSNVLFVGTMNEDETTQSLSDKVIDRANVLYFGKPEKLKTQKQSIDAAQDLSPMPHKNWEKWHREPAMHTIPGFDDMELLLNDFNTTLSKLGRPFGWRTYKAIMTYLANHPLTAVNNESAMLALSDQVAMRVMPKLRGLDLAEYESVFSELRGQLQQIDDEALMAAFRNASQSAQGFFDWRGIRW